MKIMFLGDTHGSIDWVWRCAQIAKNEECDWIVQLGDFGYWEHISRGKEFLDSVSKGLVKLGIPLVWIDGNHENHKMLRERYIDNGHQQEDGFWVIRENLYHAARGHRWEWDEVTYLALGGAWSIDKARRTEGWSWWPEETITDEEVIRASAGGKVDVLVSHDAPFGATGVIGDGTVGDKDLYPESMHNRRQLRKVCEATRPNMVFHGHYHHRNTTSFEVPGEDGSPHTITVIGLGRDYDPQAALIANLGPAAEVLA